MANLHWVGISINDLAQVAVGYSSCIAYDQKLRLADGSVMSAGQIGHAVRQGHRVDFRTSDLTGVGICNNPVTGMVRTYAKGVRIVFSDGRAVELTTGHVLPFSGEWMDESQPDHWLPVRQQWIIRAGQVEPGMVLADGRVVAVERLGKIDAVRLWLDHPAWITTADGLSVGDRHHEILPGWAVIDDEVYPEGADGETDFSAYPYPEIEVLAATGWLWSDGAGGQMDVPVGIDYRAQEEEVMTSHGLSSAYSIRRTFDQRGVMALGGSRTRRVSNGFSAVSAPLGYFGDLLAEQLAQVKPAPPVQLVWSRPEGRKLTDLLVGGIEVVGGGPVTNIHRAVSRAA